MARRSTKGIGLAVGLAAALLGGVSAARLAGWTVGSAESSGLTGSTDDAPASDAAAVREAAESGLRWMREGCLERNRAAGPAYHTRLAAYFSAAPPTGATLAAREARWREAFPTVDPAGLAEGVRAAATELAAGRLPPEKATAIAAYAPLEPSWQPGWSLLDERRADLAACQAALDDGTGWRSLDFGVESVAYDALRIQGDRATATVRMRSWTVLALGDDVERRVEVERHALELAREPDGAWRIVSQQALANPLVCGHSGYRQLREGMTAAEVRSLVGGPWRRHADAAGASPGRPPAADAWEYRFPEWGGTFSIRFGPDGRVSNVSCGWV